MIGKFRVAKAKHLQHQSARKEARKRDTAHKLIVQINIVRPLASLVFGKQHSTGHRMVAGLAVAAAGVYLVQSFHLPHGVGSMMVDGVGYGLHGLGLTPFAEYLSEAYTK